MRPILLLTRNVSKNEKKKLFRMWKQCCAWTRREAKLINFLARKVLQLAFNGALLEIEIISRKVLWELGWWWKRCYKASFVWLGYLLSFQQKRQTKQKAEFGEKDVSIISWINKARNLNRSPRKFPIKPDDGNQQSKKSRSHVTATGWSLSLNSAVDYWLNISCYALNHLTIFEPLQGRRRINSC